MVRVLIWINGAFGSGKSQTAYALHRRIPDSFVFDPEHAGFYIRRNIPKEASRPDFQDYPMWREINYAMLAYIKQEYSGTVIVPMTIVNPRYFEEIVGRLREDGHTVRHFTLSASKDVLLKRLRTRGEGKHSWAARQIDRCMEGLSADVFREHVQTDDLTVDAVTERIASMANIHLQPDTRGKIRKATDRLVTQIRQIRFFS